MELNDTLKTIPLTDIKNLKIHGRTTGRLDPLTLFWTGSAIEFEAKGSELWLEIESDYNIYEQWIFILINSVPVSRQMLTKGRYWICIFRGMDKNTVKNVRVVKDIQPMSADPQNCLQIHNVKFDGEFLPLSEKPYKIEFIGDSITSGEGTIGAKEEQDWIPMLFSAVNNYAHMTAEALNADYRIISQSGWGVLTSWDNNPNFNIPDIYEMICSAVIREKNKELGAFENNNFEAWQPDVVVVNLGTNDGGAFNSPPWKDEVTGKAYKQRLNDDGTFNKEDLKTFEQAVENFLFKLRKHNRKAHIVWVYGMLGLPMMPAICRAVDIYIKKTSDRQVSVFQLPDTINETIGARNHPGLLAHQMAANELTSYIKQIMQWR